MRLDDLKSELGDKIRIEWKSFMLRPTETGRKSRQEFLEYTKLWAPMSDLDARLEVTSPWGSEDPHPSHSLPALAASKLAKTFGEDIEAEFHRRMLRAYFHENRTVSDSDVIAAIAGEAGLDATDFASAFSEQREGLERAVFDDHNEAVQLGITAVPTVVVNNRVAVPGAQETETYIQVIDDELART